MLIHREYSNAYPSMFMIYKDRVETKNANKPVFVGQLLPGRFEPFPKNPNIAQIFTQMGRSEELGTGVKNVFKYSKAYSGSDQIIFEENDVFIAKVPLSGANLTERQLEIVGLMKRNNVISYREIAKILNINDSAVLKHIKSLKRFGIVERIGGTRGFWIVKISENE